MADPKPLAEMAREWLETWIWGFIDQANHRDKKFPGHVEATASLTALLERVAGEAAKERDEALAFLRKGAYANQEIVSTCRLTVLQIANYRVAGLMYVEPGGGVGWVCRKVPPQVEWTEQADEGRRIAEAKLADAQKEIEILARNIQGPGGWQERAERAEAAVEEQREATRPLVEALKEAWEFLAAARDVIATLQTQCGWLPEQQAYSTTMTEPEQLAARAVADIDHWFSARAALAAHEGQERKHGCANRGNCTGSNEPPAGTCPLCGNLLYSHCLREREGKKCCNSRATCHAASYSCGEPQAEETFQAASEARIEGRTQAEAPLPPIEHRFTPCEKWESVVPHREPGHNFTCPILCDICAQPEAAHKPR